jgi:hypothetical protein
LWELRERFRHCLLGSSGLRIGLWELHERFRLFLLGSNGLRTGVFGDVIVTCVWKWDNHSIAELLDACVCPDGKHAFNGLRTGVFGDAIVTCVWKWGDYNIAECMLDDCLCPGGKKAGRNQKTQSGTREAESREERLKNEKAAATACG